MLGKHEYTRSAGELKIIKQVEESKFAFFEKSNT